ncbi:PE-PPE domain-containing protein [Mycobacterium sp. EPa45]|uniref:PE-PPE domain-containing protein n=1 Tax=Mycobacterium sp. EPa45 TaxID=1545728 RepID=UPI00069B377C|nr:PE-PPE domain-containing protein [Mycobacterium sp. EPa45]
MFGFGNRGARKSASAVLAGLMMTALGSAAVVAAPPTRAAATAIILGTTFKPDPATPEYTRGAMEFFVKPTTLCRVQACSVQPVETPEQFWPFSGLLNMTIDQSIAQGLKIVDDAVRRDLSTSSEPLVVFGDSQSSTILTLEKRSLTTLSDAEKSRLVLVLVANPNRPNGGLLQRIAPFTIPVINLTGSGATPTDTGIQTIDIVCQYDAIADFPQYPLNIFAMLNLIAGAAIHSSYITGPIDYTQQELDQASQSPSNQQTYGDTVYITIPAKQLPLVVPLREFGDATGLSAITTPLADLVEPTLRVLVELGYDRSIPYGQPSGFGLFPKINLSELAFDLSSAAASGVHAALTDLGIRMPDPAPPVSAPAAVTAKTTKAAHRKASAVAPLRSARARPPVPDRPETHSASARRPAGGHARSARN